MKTWVFLVLLAPLVTSQAIYLPTNYGNITIENEQESTEDCIKSLITPVNTDEYNMSKVFFLACGLNKRKRRFVKHLPVLNQLFKPILTPTKKPMNTSEVYRRATRLNNMLKKGSVDVLFEEFNKLTSWNGTSMSSHFNYSAGKESDAWLAMSKKQIKCDDDYNVELIICGRINKGRKWATEKYVVPLVSFDKTGSILKNPEFPKFVAVVDGNMTVVKDCKKLDTYAECVADTRSRCSPSNMTSCKYTLGIHEGKVWVRHFGEFSVVAANLNNYTTVINKVISSHPIDISKHVVLRLTEGSYAIFGETKVYGRATKDFDHYTVHTKVEIPPVTNEDLDWLEARNGKKPIIAASRQLLLGKEPTNVVFYYYFAAFLIVIAVSVCCSACHIRKSKAKQARGERRVIFIQDDCEIID